jgi:phosphatidylglycerophosphate synthase/choline kinase
MCLPAARGYRNRMATTAPAGPGRARRDRARDGVPAGGSALLLATLAGADGAPAALLEVDGAPVVARLAGQLADLGLRRATVVARPANEHAVRAALAGAPIAVEVVASPGLAGDLRAVQAAARAAGGERLLVAWADVVAHREALAGLLSDPRVATGVLATASPERDPWADGVRTAHGRVQAAGSPFHRVRSPNERFLGVLKVDARDLDRAAEVAGALAALAGDEERRARLDGELDRRATHWPERDAGGRLDRARHEAPALLLVGLVRGAVAVGSTDVRDFVYARPRTAQDAAAAAAALRDSDEDRLLLDAAVKSSDGFFTTHFVSPYSRHIARFAARRGWTPNAVTLASLAIGVAATAAFATGSRAGLIAGAILLQAAFTVDCVDGQLARYTRNFSRLGAWMDSIFDRTKEYLVYAGLAIGSVHGLGDDVWTLAACALALQTARHMLDFSWAAERQGAIAAVSHAPLDEPGEGLDDGARGPLLHAAAPVAALRPALAGPPARARRPVVTPAAARNPEPGPPPSGARGLAGRGVGAIGALEGRSATRWAKRIVALPIGERFALISITAAVWTPRVTFTALLAWGAVAATYSVGGRLLRSAAA